ncbi:MAG: PAS domain S-box protein [Candidatus Hydrogenedentes bacterium]|nr:PAS domain S-box protein [Candidatus Hydrogenedentota bacterium]
MLAAGEMMKGQSQEGLVVETSTHGDTVSPSASAGNRWRDKIFRGAGIGIPYAALFFLLDMGAARHEVPVQTGISLWYAPVGLSIAVLLRFGLGYAPIYFFIMAFGNFYLWRQHEHSGPFFPIVVAAVPACIYTLCVWVLRFRFRIDTQLSQLHSAGIFVIAFGIASAIVAWAYVGVTYAVGRAADNVFHAALDFWIGDVVAILSISPFLLSIVFPWSAGFVRLTRRPDRDKELARTIRRLVPMTASTLVWFAVVLPIIGFCIAETERGHRAILYPCLIPLVFAAYWRGMKGASTGVILVSAAVAMFIDVGMQHPRLHDTQLFLITLCLTTLLLGAATTSLKTTTENLKQVQDVYRQAITAANSVPYVLDYGNDHYNYVGEGIERITGFNSREFTPELWEDRSRVVAMHGATSGLAPDDAIRRTRAGEFPTWSSEGTFVARDGSLHWIMDASVEILGEDGKPVRSIGMIQDISAIKATEEALRSSRAVLHLFVEHTPAAVAMLDREMRYLVVSKRWLHDYRLTGEDIIGKSHYEVFPEIQNNQDWLDIHQRCLSGTVEKREEDRFLRADGTEDWLRWEVHPWYDEAGEIGGIIMFTEVITERKKAAELVRQSEERLELALSGADLGLWDLEINPSRMLVNPRFAEILGYAPEEVQTDSAWWHSRIHPDDADRVVDHFWQHIQGFCSNLDYEFRVYTKSSVLLWVQLRGKIVERDTSGAPLRITGTLQDITGRKNAEAERREIEEQMQQTQKLESLGVLAGGIAHDFNNLLVGILGNADLALADAPPGSLLRETLESIVTSSERAAELCRQMLAYSGRGRFVVVPVSLNDMVREMGHLLTVTVSKRVTLVFEPEPSLPMVQADATQIRQIVMNLITNASEAIGDREGTIRMSTGTLVWTGADAGAHVLGGELRESQAYAYVRVSDNGCGMDNATLQRIFDPFFTTKFTGRGLGLAAVLGIVRGHRGAIRVESTPGVGTTFTVFLPALGDEIPDTPPAQMSDSSETRGHGVVLVVDDEDTVLGIAKLMLERQGYEVLTAIDGEAALRIFKANVDKIVLAIVDLTMPRMGGGELIHALHEIRPDLRVVLSSGYNEQEAIAQSHGEKMAGFIQKPYRTRQFYDVVAKALNHATPTD